MDCISGFQSIDRKKVKSSKRKLVSAGNSMTFISTCTKRGCLWRLEESSFVLVALNVTSHLSPHSTSSSPADSTFSKKTYQHWNREWGHLHRSLFLIEHRRELINTKNKVGPKIDPLETPALVIQNSQKLHY